MKAQQILLDLVAIPSVSPLTNRPVIEYAEKCLQENWKIKRYPYRDAAGVEKINLVASTKPGKAELALVCHTDTVPYDPQWAEAVRPVSVRACPASHSAPAGRSKVSPCQ